MSLKKNLETLKTAGFDVPDNALRFVQDKDYVERGVRSVWKCNCGHEYESPILLTEYDHGCGKKSRRTWPRA